MRVPSIEPALEPPEATLGRGWSAAADWPRTTRALPWLIAATLVLITLVPFDSIRAPVNLPVDSKLDRFAVGAMALAWVIGVSNGGSLRPRPRYLGALGIAMLCLVTVLVVGVVANLPALSALGQADEATKRLAQIAGYLTFFYIASSSIRRTELQAFCRLLVGVGCLSAVGTIIQYRTGTNEFFVVARAVLPGAFEILAVPTTATTYDQVTTSGPALHPLGDATMLALTFPFAVVGLLTSKTRRQRCWFVTAAALILAGTLATQRQTAALVPGIGFVVITLGWRKYARQLAGVGIIVLGVVQVSAPGSIRGILSQFTGSSAQSSLARISDYPAAAPDVVHSLLVGRGIGSYDVRTYRVFDNQILGMIVETGLLGLLSYLAVLLTGAYFGVREARAQDPVRGPVALAGAAALTGFALANFLYDALAFPQAPYIAFFVLALVVVACRPHVHPG